MIQCFCTRCERDRFAGWRERVLAAADENDRSLLASEIIVSIALRYPFGLATDLMSVIQALEVEETDQAAGILAEMVSTEEESMRLNPDLPRLETCTRGKS